MSTARRFPSPGASGALCVLGLGLWASCGGGAGTTIEITFRKPSDPTLLDRVDAFVFSAVDARGQLLVLRRFAPAQALRLDDVPFGRQLSFAIDGLFMDNPIVEGRSCAVDVVAGGPSPRVAMFLGPVGAFSPTVVAPPGSPRIGPVVVARQDGRVLIAGGATPDGPVLSSAQQYDARSGLWATDRDLLIPRANAAWAAIPGGALIAGGVGADGAPVGQIDRYDEVTGFQAIRVDATLALGGLAMAALPGGAVLISGGAYAGGVPVNLSWLYDGGSVLPLAVGMASPRQAHTLSVVGAGNFTAAFAIGGWGADGRPLASIELYDARGPSGAAFSLKSAVLAFPRAGHTATVLRTGEILIVGGEAGAGAPPVRAVEIFDPITSTVRPAGTLAEGRVGHTATLLGDGRVLVVGGRGAAGPLASAEIYDTAVGTFAAARSLGVPRVGHVAVPLCDGTVLVIGGGAGAELYGPKR